MPRSLCLVRVRPFYSLLRMAARRAWGALLLRHAGWHSPNHAATSRAGERMIAHRPRYALWNPSGRLASAYSFRRLNAKRLRIGTQTPFRFLSLGL